MKGIHPPTSRVSALALAAVACAGCQTQSSGVPNPFLAPNRVPPPATRAILPGHAEPYYPGDPLPVMHSQTAPVIDGGGLAWSAPRGESPNSTAVVRTAAVAVRGANEPAVAIPADGHSLRFALPAPARVEPVPFVSQSPSPIQFAATPPALHQDVAPASYDALAPEPYSPWRSPAIPSAPATSTSFVHLPASEPITAAPPAPLMIASAPVTPMDVRLRAVPSPPPRIRLPGDSVLQPGYDGFRPRGSIR